MVAENYGKPDLTSEIDYLTWARLNREGRSSGPANYILDLADKLASVCVERDAYAARCAGLVEALTKLLPFLRLQNVALSVQQAVNDALRDQPAREKAITDFIDKALAWEESVEMNRDDHLDREDDFWEALRNLEAERPQGDATTEGR